MNNSQGARIIYVDDEDDIREIALMALEDIGNMQVTAFSSGQALLHSDEPPPDLFLLDVMMPGMNGPDLLQALREKPDYRQVPVVFMTAKVQPGEIQEFLSAGAKGVIRKPFDPMTLAEEVSAYIDQGR